MSNKRYWVEESYLTSMADVIRNKTGKTDKIQFPDGFFDEIANIETAPATALPVLNEKYPQDTTIIESADGSATFNISIVTPGKPAEYTYQWYVDGKMVDGATNLSYTKSDLTSAATYNVYCEVSNEAGIVTSRVATLTVTSSKPVFTYSGTSETILDSTYNYRIKFKTSGTVKFTHLGCLENGIDVFLVGGGGSGGTSVSGQSALSAGGGGGYTRTGMVPKIEKNIEYSIVIGAGGIASSTSNAEGIRGGTTSAFDMTAEGGYGGGNATTKTGGAGGSGGGGANLIDYNGTIGGSDGGNGQSASGAPGGKGQGTTTREFGETSATLYSGGGGGACQVERSAGGDGGAGGGGKGSGTGTGGHGTANTGGGGGGTSYWGSKGGNGGSGIVVIRNHRS